VWIYIVSDQKLAIPEYFSNKLPTMDTVFDVLDEEIEIFDKNKLVFFIVADKLDQEYVCFL
jgi:hypothetical protein